MESVGVGRVLPGAVNAGGCTFSQGYYENRAFIVRCLHSSTGLQFNTFAGIRFWTKRYNTNRTVGVGTDIIECQLWLPQC